MALFGAVQRTRRDDSQLGQGVWRRAHDRFRRGLDRYHQILEGVADDDVYNELLPIANELADLLPRVRTVCARAQGRAPSSGDDIPSASGGWPADVHRALSRAGNALAVTAEAAAMYRLGSPATDTASRSVRRRAEQVREYVDEAERRLAAVPEFP